jgi:AGZA family xanthine/uracil permease-like MFS transporter
MGARSGYSTLNGIFITTICLTGSMAMIAWSVPVDAGLALMIWVGITITIQAFEVTPQRHWPAVVIGMLPVLLAWASFSIKNAIRIANPGVVFSPALLDAFHAAGTYPDGGYALEQGTFYCALILSAVTVFVIERRLLTAAAWALSAGLLSALGLMHSWQFAGTDTVSTLPLLERLAGITGQATLFPAAAYAWGYLGLAAILVAAKWFTVPSGPDEPPASH